MILYPAIDLKQGQAVRLVRGDMASATTFNDDPADPAIQFAAAGSRWLHVVDLDGAFAGAPANREAVRRILSATSLPVQLGGGLRSLDVIEGWLAEGVARVILGTAAVRDPALVVSACRAFPDRVAVGIDARNGRVAVAGWAETSDMAVPDLAKRYEQAGVAAIIHTDIDRDGTLAGANVAATDGLARAVAVPVIASGGIGSLADIQAVGAAGTIAGVIIGRALYDGRVDLRQALAMTGDPGARDPDTRDADIRTSGTRASGAGGTGGPAPC